jgi:hypothetical protein
MIRAYCSLVLAEYSIMGTEQHVRSLDVTGFKQGILQNRKQVLS